MLWTFTRATDPAPVFHKPMFYAVLQGTKVLTLGQNRFLLSPGDCAATSFGLPFIAHVEGATPVRPYIAIGLDLDIDLLITVMLEMPKNENRWVCSAAGGRLDGAVGDAFVRLAGLLSEPEDLPMLGLQYERELY